MSKCNSAQVKVILSLLHSVSSDYGKYGVRAPTMAFFVCFSFFENGFSTFLGWFYRFLAQPFVSTAFSGSAKPHLPATAKTSSDPSQD